MVMARGDFLMAHVVALLRGNNNLLGVEREQELYLFAKG